MKVSYQLVSGGAYVTLFDDSLGDDSVLEDFPPHFRSLNQHRPMFQSDAEFRSNLGNTVVTFPLKFYQTYDSRAHCLASVRTFAALKDQKMHLKLEQDSEVQYYPNALAEDYSFAFAGFGASHAFNFSSDSVTVTAP